MKRKLSPRRCDVCHEFIPLARLQAIPDTRTCVSHSCVRPLTSREIQIDGVDPSELRSSNAFDNK